MIMWIELKRHFDTRAVEWMSAFMLTAWGSYVILHPGVFSGPLAPAFTGMSRIAPQEVWGFTSFLIGFIRIVALFINGQWGLTPIIRVATSFMSVFVWFWLSVGLYLSTVPAPGLVLYLGLMMSDMYSAFRAASDAYEAEAMKRLKELTEDGSNVASFRTR
jgi:hypothetical protein